MNIENEIFKRLQKLKSERLAKKEKLGAIEDAVNEVQGKIDELNTRLEDVLNIALQQENEVLNGIQGYVNQAKEYSTTAQYDWEEIVLEYQDLTSELDALGIPYTELDSNILSDLKDTIEYAQTKLINIDL